MNVADPFVRQAERTPSAIAVIEGVVTTTYGALAIGVARAAARFLAAGWGPGAPVAVTLRYPAAVQLTTMLALARIGAVQVLIDPHAPPRERGRTIDRFGIRGVVATSASRRGRLPTIAADPSWLSADGDRPAGTDGFPGGDATWTIFLSSGTTGTPKAMAIGHAAEMARTALQPEGILPGPGDAVLSLIRPELRSGQSVALRCLGRGATFVAVPHDAPAQMTIELMRASGATHLIATPSQLAALLPHLDAGSPGFPRLRVLRTNAGAMTPALLDEVRTRITPHVHVDYGTNDCGTIAIAAPADLDTHPRSVGRPLPGISLEIVDECGAPLPAGTRGHVRVKSPGMVTGYLDDPQATARMFRDGWFHPGDIGEVDGAGRLFLHGRVDSVMNFGGLKISATEIEAAALRHPGVAEACAFAVPSRRFESVPAVAVVRRPGARLDRLADHLARELGARMPRHVVVVDRIPRTPAGKIAGRRLLALVNAQRRR